MVLASSAGVARFSKVGAATAAVEATRNAPDSVTVPAVSARYTTGAATVPESPAPKASGALSRYSPAAMRTLIGKRVLPACIASRLARTRVWAAVKVRSGPSVRSAFGALKVPLQPSLPPLAT